MSALFSAIAAAERIALTLVSGFIDSGPIPNVIESKTSKIHAVL